MLEKIFVLNDENETKVSYFSGTGAKKLLFMACLKELQWSSAEYIVKGETFPRYDQKARIWDYVEQHVQIYEHNQLALS